METLHISLKPLELERVELRYWRSRSSQYERQVLSLSAIAKLLEQSELDYYVLRLDLAKMGQELFVWLDGYGRWLSRAIDECVQEGIVQRSQQRRDWQTCRGRCYMTGRVF